MTRIYQTKYCLTKPIEYIVTGFNVATYRLELQRVKLLASLSLLNSDNLVLERLYQSYLKKVLQGVIRTKSKFGLIDLSSSPEKNVFLEFRKTNKGRLTLGQERYLMAKLKSSVGKWFVPYVLDTVESFSTKLMEELLEASIQIWDPSSNYCFIRPALRVHRVKVYDYLLDRFEQSTDTEKGGILRALYWVKPKAVWLRETGEIQEDYLLKYKWNEKGYYERDYDESEVEMIQYVDENSLRAERQVEIFHKEYKRTRNKRLKRVLRTQLPPELHN